VRLNVRLTKNLFKDRSFLKEIVLDREQWQDVEFDLRKNTGSEVLLVFEVSRTWNPQEESGAPDPRDLGIAVGTAKFEDLPLSQNEKPDAAMTALLTFRQTAWQGKWEENLMRTGKSWIDATLPAGKFLLRIWAEGQKAGGEWPYMVVWIDDEMVGETWVDSDGMNPYTFQITVKEGSCRIGVAFMNDYYERIPNVDRNLILGHLEIFKID